MYRNAACAGVAAVVTTVIWRTIVTAALSLPWPLGQHLHGLSVLGKGRCHIGRASRFLLV
jgi:hypothetical protein